MHRDERVPYAAEASFTYRGTRWVIGGGLGRAECGPQKVRTSAGKRVAYRRELSARQVNDAVIFQSGAIREENSTDSSEQGSVATEQKSEKERKYGASKRQGGRGGVLKLRLLASSFLMPKKKSQIKRSLRLGRGGVGLKKRDQKLDRTRQKAGT